MSSECLSIQGRSKRLTSILAVDDQKFKQKKPPEGGLYGHYEDYYDRVYLPGVAGSLVSFLRTP